MLREVSTYWVLNLLFPRPHDSAVILRPNIEGKETVRAIFMGTQKKDHGTRQIPLPQTKLVE